MTSTCLGDSQNGLQTYEPAASCLNDFSVPFATKMLCDDRHEPLHTAQNSTMNHHGPRWFLTFLQDLLTTIFQPKSLRKLEVQLDGRTLMPSLESILDANVDFRSVERSVSRIERPFTWVMCVQRIFEALFRKKLEEIRIGEIYTAHLFSYVPSLDFSKEGVGTRGELKLIFESEKTVDFIQKLEQFVDLPSDLIGHAD